MLSLPPKGYEILRKKDLIYLVFFGVYGLRSLHCPGEFFII